MTDREMIVAAIHRIYPVPPNKPYDVKKKLLHARNVEFTHFGKARPLRYDDDGKCNIQIYRSYEGNPKFVGCVTLHFDDAGALLELIAER